MQACALLRRREVCRWWPLEAGAEVEFDRLEPMVWRRALEERQRVSEVFCAALEYDGLEC